MTSALGPSRFSLRFALAAIAVLSIGLSWTHYSRQANEADLRLQVHNHFKHVAIVLRNFDERFGQLPPPVIHEGGGRRTRTIIEELRPDGKPLYSWRFLVLPYVATNPAGSPGFDFLQSWDAPSNAFGRSFPNTYGDDDGMTRVFAITGPGTAFGDSVTERPRSLADIPGDTLLAVEVAQSNCHWMSPKDFDIRTMPRTIGDRDTGGISGTCRSGFFTVFADGTVMHLGNDVPFETLEKFFTLEGARRYDREAELGPYQQEP